MERLYKKLKKCLVALSAVMLFVLFTGAVPVLATEISETVESSDITVEETTVEETDVAVEGDEEQSTQEKALEVLEKSVLKAEKDSYTYNGKAVTPALKLIYTDESEEEYDVTENFVIETPVYGDNNVDVGTVSFSAVISGYYEEGEDGEKTAVLFDETVAEVRKEGSFKITPVSIKDASVTLSQTSYTYDGKAKKPSVKELIVKLDSEDTKLKSGTDYTVSYKNNTNAGSATITVKGTGNYSGSLSKKFTIKAKSLSSASVSLSTTKYAYNGKDRKPGTTVKIKLSSTVTLKKDQDYTVTYSKDCKSIGLKTVRIKGKGNYTGELKKIYTVVPEKASGLKVSKRTTTSLEVTCNKAKNSGCKYHFLVQQYNSSKDKWEEVSSKYVTSNKATLSKLTPGRAYHLYVRIYKKGDDKNYIGGWSSLMKTATSPSKPVMSHAVKTGSKTMSVAWKAVNIATGYEIQYSTSSDFSSNSKTIKVTGRTTTSKKISLKSTKTYYVRVRAYRDYNDHTYRSAWSSKVSTSWSNVYSSYSTEYNSSNKNRTTNLRLACNAINGTVLSNGKTFSFNGTVGERTSAKGYKEAIIYEGGREVGGIGGGICQVATTLFNAALKANFKIVERHQHSLTVHYCPLGYDAAIAWGSKNLRFQNNAGVSVKIQMKLSGGTMTAKILTNTAKKPPKVTTKVTKRNGVYTLKRYVNGKCNYTTTSDYMDD